MSNFSKPSFEQIIESNRLLIQPVIDFDTSKDRLLQMDFTAANTELTNEILDDTALFSAWVNQKLATRDARYGIGGYDEHRTIYSRSAHFDTGEEPRRLHLGVDIWAPAGTTVYNFFDATVHSFANNNHFGDYGATIILTYDIEGIQFNVLHGHLSLSSLDGLTAGKFIPAATPFATLGVKEENGYWPPHLHFQVIQDMEGLKGDYPGVCKYSEREKYLANCPDPNIILQSTFIA
ncbi:peptidoglycan DD-metalloendopeptidase family protein [Pedobacter sp. BMA]|uniref:peptidoglycan DD-metalloendopeptidase family protein n=1 Tax=Pedobacter sp. BMA TaxID=1663685 RepID=UPI00064971E8|nr:peptidoglycan DD-metalloendopeptidase family protein [Pedobacter sp. BMA]KLT64985.1 peptidase M23 [Pedobacter sp. BMA]